MISRPRKPHAPLSLHVFPADQYTDNALYVYPDHEGSHYAYYGRVSDASMRRLMRYLKAWYEPTRVVFFDNGQVNNATWEVR